jgi:hypothetical protein
MFFYGLLCFYSFHDTSAKLSYTLPRVQPHAHTHPVMTRRIPPKTNDFKKNSSPLSPGLKSLSFYSGSPPVLLLHVQNPSQIPSWLVCSCKSAHRVHRHRFMRACYIKCACWTTNYPSLYLLILFVHVFTEETGQVGDSYPAPQESCWPQKVHRSFYHPL